MSDMEYFECGACHQQARSSRWTIWHTKMGEMERGMGWVGRAKNLPDKGNREYTPIIPPFPAHETVLMAVVTGW